MGCFQEADEFEDIQIFQLGGGRSVVFAGRNRAEEQEETGRNLLTPADFVHAFFADPQLHAQAGDEREQFAVSFEQVGHFHRRGVGRMALFVREWLFHAVKIAVFTENPSPRNQGEGLYLSLNRVISNSVVHASDGHSGLGEVIHRGHRPVGLDAEVAEFGRAVYASRAW